MTKLTAAEAATIAKCSPRAVRRAAERGTLAATKHGKAWVIDPADLQVWQDSRRMGKPPLGEITYAKAAAMLGMTESGIGYHVRQGNLPREMTAEAVVEFALYEREAEMTACTEWWDTHGERYILWYFAGYEPDCTDEWLLTPDEALASYHYPTCAELCNAMKEVAPLIEWRVVKG